MEQLLAVDPNDRIDGQGIADHPFFADIDWARVEAKGYEPEYVPGDLLSERAIAAGLQDPSVPVITVAPDEDDPAPEVCGQLCVVLFV